MKNNQNKKGHDNDKDLVNDINSVPKAINNESSNNNVDDPKRPAQSGRHEGNSVQDGGQDIGSSAGSH